MTYPNDPERHPQQSAQPNDSERQRLQVEQDRLARSQRALMVQKLIQIVCFLIGSLEILLALRFMLRLTGANPNNAFANAIYAISAPFVNPLSTLFISPTANGSTNIFDVNVVVAMFAYFILMLIVVWLIRIIGDVDS